MANVKIYYLDFHQDYYGEQFLYRERDLYDDRYVFTKCPVFNHKSNRTFVGFSPIDFTIRVDRNHELVLSDNENLLHYDMDHLLSPNPVFQLKFPKFLFWTNEPNVWWEYRSHPMTSLNNNYVGVEGWFNLSNWPRSMSNAFTIVDPTKPVIIKKGDPIFRVSFYPQDLNSGIILKKVSNKEKINQILNQYHSIDKTKTNWIGKLFSKTNIKTCPFKFLYNK